MADYEQIPITSFTSERIRYMRRHWSQMLYCNDQGLTLGATIGIMMDIHQEQLEHLKIDADVLKRHAFKYPRKGRPKKRKDVASPNLLDNLKG